MKVVLSTYIIHFCIVKRECVAVSLGECTMQSVLSVDDEHIYCLYWAWSWSIFLKYDYGLFVVCVLFGKVNWITWTLKYLTINEWWEICHWIQNNLFVSSITIVVFWWDWKHSKAECIWIWFNFNIPKSTVYLLTLYTSAIDV